MKVVTSEQRADEQEILVGEGKHETKGHCFQEEGNTNIDVKEEYGSWMLVRHRKAGANLRGTRGLSHKVGNGPPTSPISHSESRGPRAQHSPTRTDVKSNHGLIDGKRKKEQQDVSGAILNTGEVLLEKGETSNPNMASSSRPQMRSIPNPQTLISPPNGATSAETLFASLVKKRNSGNNRKGIGRARLFTPTEIGKVQGNTHGSKQRSAVGNIS